MLFTMTPLKKKRHPAYTNHGTHTMYRSQNNQKPTNTKVHWHTIEFSHIITTQSYRPSEDGTQYCE